MDKAIRKITDLIIDNKYYGHKDTVNRLTDIKKDLLSIKKDLKNAFK